MAIKPDVNYVGKITPGGASYPYGSARNVTVPGDGTGTPFEQAWVNDLFGLEQKLLDAANIVPSGNAETILASDYYDALHKIFSPQALCNVAGTVDAIVLTTVLAAPDALADGQIIYFKASGDNTGAVTINRDAFGVKDLKLKDGTALSAGHIKSGQYVQAIYRLAADRYEYLSNNITGIQDLSTVPAVTLSSAGNVGIGETSPSALLHITDSSADSTPGIRIENDVQRWDIKVDGAGAGVLADRFLILDDTGAIAPVSVEKSTGDVELINDLGVGGTLSKAAGTFKIDHPLDPANKTLYHGFVESPRYDLIYRGQAVCKDGKARVSIDKASNMAPGTFEALTQDAQCFTSNNETWDRVRGQVIGGELEILCEADHPVTVDWMVVAERADAYIKSAKGTDKNGHLLVEVDKVAPTEAELELLQDVTMEADKAGERTQRVQDLIGKRGYKLHPEAVGEKHPERRVILKKAPPAPSGKKPA
jgi:hypothetical protein